MMSRDYLQITCVSIAATRYTVGDKSRERGSWERIDGMPKSTYVITLKDTLGLLQLSQTCILQVRGVGTNI